MAEIILRSRSVGNDRYVQCPECRHDIQIEAQTRLDMPYCSSCGKIVLDADQKFCCWCGVIMGRSIPMDEHNDELGFFFCENCGHVHKSDVPYEKLTEECSHCGFSTWVWEPKGDEGETFALQCSCSRKIEGVVGGELGADILRCDCGKTWFVSRGTAVEESEYTHTRVDRLAALERLYNAVQTLVGDTYAYEFAPSSNVDALRVILADIERMEAEAHGN